MDEIWFHLSNQLEGLQIQTLVVAQQGQQWITTWVAQANQFLEDLYNEAGTQQAKQFLQRILFCIQNGWDQILMQYYSIHYNARGLYRQLINSFSNEVSKREVTLCLASIAVGTIIGYYAGIYWRGLPYQESCMKAVICHHYIGIEGTSVIEDVEIPSIKRDDELLIHVKAASINVVDVQICHGYSNMYRRLLNSGKHKYLPVILGRDCAGVVVGIGQRVINFDIGDNVFLAVPSWASGTLANYIVVSENQVVRRPKFLSFEAAASLPYNGCIAWDALINQSVIGEGNAKDKRVLISGGTTPVGCILTQLVKLWGGYVTTICMSDAAGVSKALGADAVIILNETDIEKELRLFDKYDAIFYTGGQAVDEHLLKRHLLPYGSYVSTMPEELTSDSLGFVTSTLFAGLVKIKLLVQYIFGFNTNQWRDGSKINTTHLQSLCNLADANKIQVVVDKVCPPHHIEQALYHIVDPYAIGSTIISFQ